MVQVVEPADMPAPSSSWQEEEAYIRTGVYAGRNLGVVGPAANPAAAWAATVHGGSDIVRPLRPYAQDGARTEGMSSCNKYKESNQSLLPGCLLGWCLDCGICNSLALMTNSESPRSVFELLFTRWQEAPEILCYDNGCNAMQYCLNRECAFFGSTLFYIDAMHYNDHKRCATDFSSGTCDAIKNSSLAEQKNSIVRSLEHNCGYMGQVTFLLYLRYFLHRMNKLQRMRNAGQSWF